MRREWEVWNVELADELHRLWGEPGHTTGRHWELLYRSATLIEGTTVLDVGCGQGHLYELIKSRGYDYLGIDNSEAMIAKAKSFFPEEEHRFQIGDIYDLSPYKQYDTVICISVLVHLPDPHDEAIRQLWDKTKHTLVMEIWPDKKPLCNKTWGYSGEEDKYVIRNWKPLRDYYFIIADLPDVGKIERFFFDERSSLLRLTRGVRKPKARKYKEWE